MKTLQLVIATLVLGTTSALAQQKTYTLQVTESDLAALSKSLGKAPYEEVAPIVQRLGAQVQQQLEARQAPQPPAALAPHAAPQASQAPDRQPAAPSPAPVPTASGMEADLKARGKARPSLPADYGKPVPQAPVAQ